MFRWLVFYTKLGPSSLRCIVKSTHLSRPFSSFSIVNAGNWEVHRHLDCASALVCCLSRIVAPSKTRGSRVIHGPDQSQTHFSPGTQPATVLTFDVWLSTCVHHCQFDGQFVKKNPYDRREDLSTLFCLATEAPEIRTDIRCVLCRCCGEMLASAQLWKNE